MKIAFYLAKTHKRENEFYILDDKPIENLKKFL